MADDAAGFIGGIPDHYDHFLGPNIFADYAADIARLVAAAKPARVLETAAGTGIVTRALRDALPPATEIVATDLNPPMLEVAQRKFRPGERVTFAPADAQALPYPDASFDAVVCQFGIMFYPDKDKGYREARRVLRPGGRYFFSTWDGHGFNAFARITSEASSLAFPDNPPPFYQVPFSCAAIDPIKGALGAAGFGDVTVRVIRHDKPVPDIAGFARGLVYGNPLIDQVRGRGGDPEALVEAVRRALARDLGTPPHMTIQAMLYEAERG
jgi:SAM-dependent methyltransferase